MFVCRHMYKDTNAKGREQFWVDSSLLPPSESQGSDSGPQPLKPVTVIHPVLVPLSPVKTACMHFWNHPQNHL